MLELTQIRHHGHLTSSPHMLGKPGGGKEECGQNSTDIENHGNETWARYLFFTCLEVTHPSR